MSNCNQCKKPMRSSHALLADAPGTVAAGAGGLCAADYQRARRHAVRPPKPKFSVGSFAAMTSTPEAIAAVYRMVSARFPDDPEVAQMLGVA